MNEKALDWAIGIMRDRAERAMHADPHVGLRERKKRVTRQLISDTATALFLQRGYHQVRVAEIAAAAGVSEKTVFNYFPTKESLVLDREEIVASQLRHSLAHGDPVAAAVEAIAADVRDLNRDFDDIRRRDEVVQMFSRFTDMVESTPELRAAQQDMLDRLTQIAAEVLAGRVGVDPGDPEPQIAATAIVGLWRIMQRSSARHVRSGHPAVAEAVIADVRRAARLIDSGLWSFGAIVQGNEDLEAAGDQVHDTVRQVVAAVRKARSAIPRSGST